MNKLKHKQDGNSSSSGSPAVRQGKVAHDDAVMDEEAADVHAGRRVQSDEIVISRKVGKGRELRVDSRVCVSVCVRACVS